MEQTGYKITLTVSSLEDGRWVTQYDYDGNININCIPHSLINGQSEAISSVSSHFLGGIKGYLFFEIGDANSSNFLISWDVPTIGSPVYSSDGLSEEKIEEYVHFMDSVNNDVSPLSLVKAI
ncbi:13920_t:CDS:2 [Entrophospora sp. SA101]|nr:13920_t:CDS:2 [Entrophospora sp. SA101]